jgi:hypothetical protein
VATVFVWEDMVDVKDQGARGTSEGVLLRRIKARVLHYVTWELNVNGCAPLSPVNTTGMITDKVLSLFIYLQGKILSRYISVFLTNCEIFQ